MHTVCAMRRYGTQHPHAHATTHVLADEDAMAARAFLLRLVGALTAFGAPATTVERLGESAAKGLLLQMDGNQTSLHCI